MTSLFSVTTTFITFFMVFRWAVGLGLGLGFFMVFRWAWVAAQPKPYTEMSVFYVQS